MSFLANFFSNRARLNLVMRACEHYAACKDVPAEDRAYMRQMLRTMYEINN